MAGGRGLTWRSGQVVVRPAGDPEEAAWKLQVLEGIGRSDFSRLSLTYSGAVTQHFKTDYNPLIS